MATLNRQTLKIVRDKFIFEISSTKDELKINAFDAKYYYKWSGVINCITPMPSIFTPQNIFYIIRDYDTVDESAQVIYPKTFGSPYESLTIKIICTLNLYGDKSDHEFSLNLKHVASICENRLGTRSILIAHPINVKM